MYPNFPHYLRTSFYRTSCCVDIIYYYNTIYVCIQLCFLYGKRPLKILKAEELVGGEAAMDEILHGLFNRELDPMYPYLTYQEFLDACGLTEEDLTLD